MSDKEIRIKKVPFGFTPETYYPLVRGMGGKFTLEELTEAIKKGLYVRNIGDKRAKEISDILGRKVVLFDKPRVVNVLGYVGITHDRYLAFEKEGES